MKSIIVLLLALSSTAFAKAPQVCENHNSSNSGFAAAPTVQPVPKRVKVKFWTDTIDCSPSGCVEYGAYKVEHNLEKEFTKIDAMGKIFYSAAFDVTKDHPEVGEVKFYFIISYTHDEILGRPVYSILVYGGKQEVGFVTNPTSLQFYPGAVPARVTSHFNAGSFQDSVDRTIRVKGQLIILDLEIEAE